MAKYFASCFSEHGTKKLNNCHVLVLTLIHLVMYAKIQNYNNNNINNKSNLSITIRCLKCNKHCYCSTIRCYESSFKNTTI